MCMPHDFQHELLDGHTDDCKEIMQMSVSLWFALVSMRLCREDNNKFVNFFQEQLLVLVLALCLSHGGALDRL